MGYYIHEVDSKDQVAIAAVAKLESQLFIDEAWSAQSIEQWLALPSNLAYVLIQQQQAVGYCLYSQLFDTAEIIRIAVDAAYQQQGWGAILINTLLQRLQQAQVDNLLLEVRIDSSAAIRLYQKYGFVHIHTRQGYYQHRDGATTDAWIMQRLSDENG